MNLRPLLLFIFLILTNLGFSQIVETYVKETVILTTKGDSLFFNYNYVFDKPDMFDEELFKTLNFLLLLKDISKGKNVSIANYNIPIRAIIYGSWGNYRVEKLWGNIEIIEMDDKYIKLSIKLSGVYGRQEVRREFINKVLLFER